MRVTFDHTIASALSSDQLWQLIVQSFRNSDESPIWPHGLELVRSAQVVAGALVRATYITPGGLKSNVTYRFAEVEPGRLRYETEPSHPLRGGGTVEVLTAPADSLLHWYGGYDVPWRPQALFAAAFTRLYFEGKFFATLESNLRVR